MLISLISAKGSPGVTTAALAAGSRWPREVMVADLDPLCGDVLAGVAGGRIPAQANLGELMVTARTTGVVAALPSQLIRPTWPPGCPILLPGLGAPGQAQSLSWEALASGLAAVPWADVVADCGRWGTAPTPVPVLRASDLVVLVMRSTLRSVHAAARAVPVIRESLGRHDGLTAIVVGPGQPYTEREITSQLDIPVIGTVAWDPRTAHVWSDGGSVPRSFDGTQLQRGAGKLATDLITHAEAHRAALHAHNPQSATDAPVAIGAGPQPGAVDDPERTQVRRLGPGGQQIPLRPLQRRARSDAPARNGWGEESQ